MSGVIIDRTCEHCGRAFTALRYKVARGLGRYCSRACYAAAKLTPEAVSARFWSWVERGHGDACWPWKGCVDVAGYGMFTIGRRHVVAHRFALETRLGSPLGELFALHRCDNPPCCNPAHLFPGTQLDNMRDRNAKGRANVARGEGKRGTRLTSVTVVEARRLRATGLTIAQVSSQLGVGWGCVRSALAGATWKHVP